MLLSGFANAFAREPLSSHEHVIDALRQRATSLQAEIATLRADFAGLRSPFASERALTCLTSGRKNG
jgi:hypothetical protein